MDSKRILITGISHYWGGRLAQALEQNDEIEAIIGVDNHDPTLELERTEFVRVGTQHGLLRRIVEAAMRARVPIVPVCVVGAEEAAPIFAHISPLQRLTGLLYAPLSPIFPVTLFMPAKFRLRFLEPIRFDEDDMWLDKSLVQTVSQEIRARIQENLDEMVARRKSVWLG